MLRPEHFSRAFSGKCSGKWSFIPENAPENDHLSGKMLRKNAPENGHLSGKMLRKNAPENDHLLRASSHGMPRG